MRGTDRFSHDFCKLAVTAKSCWTAETDWSQDLLLNISPGFSVESGKMCGIWAVGEISPKNVWMSGEIFSIVAFVVLEPGDCFENKLIWHVCV